VELASFLTASWRACLVTISVVLLCGSAFAADQFPGQPNISGACDKLASALENLGKYQKDLKHEHIESAVQDLAAAETFLEESSKNKGTYRESAIQLVESAKKVLSAEKLISDQVNQGTNLVKDALAKTMKAGKVGAKKQ